MFRYPKSTKFDTQKMGLNICCDIPTHESTPKELCFFLPCLGSGGTGAHAQLNHALVEFCCQVGLIVTNKIKQVGDKTLQ
jgi:hypothetical protein